MPVHALSRRARFLPRAGGQDRLLNQRRAP